MYGYRCDICGCYLDPDEGRRCEECQRAVETRILKMKRIGEAICIDENQQYEMMMEER